MKSSELNLLYLEESESITHIFRAVLKFYNPIDRNSICEEGHFYICSRSFVFKNDDVKCLIRKFKFKYIDEI